MSIALTSIATLAAGPVTMLGLIPLLAIGMSYYRYQSVDPEGRPIDATKVSGSQFSLFIRSHTQTILIK